MKRLTLTSFRRSVSALAGLALAAVAHAQPAINNVYPNGTHLLQPSSTLSFTASSAAGVTNVSVQLTLTNMSTLQSYVRTLSSAYGLTISGPATSQTVSAPLITNALYSAVIQVTDASNGTASQTVMFDTISGYVFEAEDYDYTANGTTGLFFDNPQTNAYANLGATAGIDCWNASSGGSSSYRPNPNPQTSGGPGGLATEATGDTSRLAYAGTGKTDYDVGWTAGGHFGNYTRHYPAGTYNIYMRASQPNVALQSDAASVTVAAGSASFSSFGPYQFSIPNTGGWQNFTYVPLIDASLAAPAQIVFDGTASTLTVTIDGGNCNENFFVLIPAETTIPVSSVGFPWSYPDGTALYQDTNTFTFEATSPDPISPGDMTVIVTGTNLWGQGSVTTLTVNHGLTVTDNSGGAKTDWLVNFPLVTNTIYSVYLQVFDQTGIPATTTVRFDTINPNSYTFEAEDYNYTDSNGKAGLFFDNPQTNAYSAMSATEGIDDHVVSTGGNNAYGRSAYPAGSSPACMSIESCSDATRPAYNGTGFGNYDLGNATSGNWANYTRTFPTGTYNIYLRAANNNGGNSDSASLYQVLSDPTQPNQKAASLGTFSVPNTGGWQSYQYVPLIDQFGKLARITGGLGTLRLTTDKGNYNADFLLLTPAQPGLNSPPYANAFTPDGTSALYQYATNCSFLVHSSVGISTNNIKVTMDGVPISGVTFSGTPTLWSVSAPVSVNGYHTAIITMTDSVGTTSDTFQFNTFDPVKSYLFEAEDFNYTDGAGNTGQFFDNPQVNAYDGLPATQGIDAFAQPGNLGTGGMLYRGGAVAVVGQGLCVENASDSLESAGHAGVQNYDLGNTDNGNWGDYTRTYPTGTYNIYMRAANGGGTSGRGSAALVTAGWGTANQTLLPIGNFDPVLGTGGWQIYTWVACKDKNGNLGQVTLNGSTNTLRMTSGGGYNADYFVLVPVNGTLPIAANVYPNGQTQFQGTNTLSFNAISSAGIGTNSIVVTLNGTTLSNLVITGSSTNWHVSYTGLQPNSLYTATITFQNLAGAGYTTSISFDTYSPNNYQWEAADWDYTTNGVSGLFHDNPQINAYAGAESAENIDVAETITAQPPFTYRPNDISAVPTTDVSDDVPRIQFGTQPAYRVDYFGYGSWVNYTRHYPAGSYYVLGRFTEGGADTVATLSKVTSGWGTTSQSTTYLGTFNIPLGGWDTWESAYLADGSGKRIALTFDGSQQTLRFTGNPVQAGDPTINVSFFVLVPAPQLITLTATLSGGNVTISFPTLTGSSYQVEYKTHLTDATWTSLGSPISGNNSPQSVKDSATGSSRFYRVQVQ